MTPTATVLECAVELSALVAVIAPPSLPPVPSLPVPVPLPELPATPNDELGRESAASVAEIVMNVEGRSWRIEVGSPVSPSLDEVDFVGGAEEIEAVDLLPPPRCAAKVVVDCAGASWAEVCEGARSVGTAVVEVVAWGGDGELGWFAEVAGVEETASGEAGDASAAEG